MFAVTDEARRYIIRKGGHVRICLKNLLVCNRSCQSPQGFRRQPVVQLGKPHPDEREFYTSTQLDDITIWYETNGIIPEDPAQPIIISLKKSLFFSELQVQGAKPEVKVV